MNRDERAKARALAGCRLGVYSGEKRFIRQLYYIAGHDPDTALTPGQKWYLDHLVYRYRRQLAGSDGVSIPDSAPQRADYVAAQQQRQESRRSAREAREGPIPVQQVMFE